MSRIPHPLRFACTLLGTLVLAGVVTFCVPLTREYRCDRKTNACTYATVFVGRTRLEHHALTSLSSARVDMVQTFPASPEFRVWIVFRDGEWLACAYPTRSEAEEEVRTIRQFEQTADLSHFVAVCSSRVGHWIVWGSIPVFGYLFVSLLSSVVGPPRAANDKHLDPPAAPPLGEQPQRSASRNESSCCHHRHSNASIWRAAPASSAAIINCDTG